MKSWGERPPEVAHLLNPAFCGEVIRRALEGHMTVDNQGMPFSISFLILPIVLDKSIRDALPKRQNSPKMMHAWLQENPELRIKFPQRTRNLVPVSREALMFLLQNETIYYNQEGALLPNLITSAEQNKLIQSRTDEVADCYRRAALIGRWFGMAHSPTTIFTMWGVRP